MKKVIFTIEVEFQDSICSNNGIKEIAENLLNGLIQQANGEGIAPDESETFTKSIQISKKNFNTIKHEL